MMYHFVPLRIFNHGTYGVLLFFIISGYCISFSVESSRTAWHFYARRLGRLLPALFVCSLVTTSFKHLAPQLIDADRLSTWWIFAYELVGIPTLNALQMRLGFADGAYWSLLNEFYFYLVCFGIMAVGMRVHILKLFCAFAALHTFTTGITGDGPNEVAPYFIVGMGIAAIAEGQNREGFAAILFAFALDLYHLVFHFTFVSIEPSPMRTAFLWLATGVVYLASNYRPSALVSKALAPLAFVGLISYPLYLIHDDVGNMIIKWLGLSTDAESLLLRGIGLPAFLILLATAVYFLIERQAIKPLTDFLARPIRTESIANSSDDFRKKEYAQP
jgi:peptidoglycan/LPS O-acetylase OafA/YrhL